MSAAFRTIRELGADLRAGRVSPVALAETCLDRLETVGRKLNAVVTLTRERALEQARRAERELKAGHDRGPLHGIPYGAKDLLATSGGIPTTWGAAPFRDRCFDYDATVIRRLEEAGAVLVAKLAMVEVAGGMGYRQPNASFTGPGHLAVGERRVERRIVERLGLRGRRGARALRHRLGDVGLDPRTSDVLRRHRAAADVRSRESARRDAALLDARQARPAGAHG